MSLDIIQTQITFLESVIPDLQAVILKLSTNPRATYSVNTGQSSESVTGKDVNRLRALLNGFISDLQYYSDLAEGEGDPSYSRPDF